MSIAQRLSSYCLGVSLCLTGCGQGGIFESTYNALTNSETREITQRQPPAPKDPALQDDILSEKHPIFDPDLADRRKFGDWEVNLSEAITALDVPMVQTDREPQLLQLFPSYSHLLEQQRIHFPELAILPSVNMLDGKAKQFDDGLYAALEQALLQGNEPDIASHENLIRQWLAEVPADGKAADFLKAGLKLLESNDTSSLLASGESEGVQQWLSKFQREELANPPIAFYSWNEDLEKCWRFGSYFQIPFALESPEAVELIEALRKNTTLLEQYQKILTLYASLSNPPADPSFLSLIDPDVPRSTAINSVTLFPQSTSRETELFNKLFRDGIPRDANLMLELVRRIRSGAIDLRPHPIDSSAPSGWYDYQVYALETLLVAEKGDEFHKLLLSKNYKQRMMDAFKALISKRRETHAKSMAPTDSPAVSQKPTVLVPRLRVEPAPSYYLRTARSYQFLQNVLLTHLGEEYLKQLHGLKKEGERPLDLAAELEEVKNLFYGLYLISCEDIGLRPQLDSGEVENETLCYDSAQAWLNKLWDDSDFATDTRVSVPIGADPQRNTTRLWTTVGVRLAKLQTRYATPPKIRVAGSGGDWEDAAGIKLGSITYLIAVDEFVEFEIRGTRGISREKLRSALPSGKTREELLQALQATFGKP
jgi:hypothetical protein